MPRSSLLPGLLAHADWSVDPAKRWMCIAQRVGRRFIVQGPELVGPVVDRLGSLSSTDGPALLGIDVAIGLPSSYAAAAGITSFATWFRGDGACADGFGMPAALASEISLERPFYPARPGGARQTHLVAGLGVERFDDLRRTCERSPPLARPACPLFWTLGANQVGKAALVAWADLRRAPGLRLWPFDGELDGLLASGGLVVAETYPTACAGFVGLGFGPRESKRRQPDRRARATLLRAVAVDLDVELEPALEGDIADGFGPEVDGEDRFDALVGLLGLVHVLRGHRPPGPPVTVPEARSVEGWILGV